MEDYPLLLLVTRAGFFIHYLDAVTVAYRISATSASNYGSEKIFNDLYRKNKMFNEKYRYPYLKKSRLLFEKSEIIRKNIFTTLGMNKRNAFFLFIYSISIRLNPLYWTLSKWERSKIY